MSPNNWKLPTRRLAAIAIGLLALLVAVVTWQFTSLRGLPDIGDPFDVAAFSSVQIREEDNAYVFYRQAAAKLLDKDRAFSRDWFTASEADKHWLEQNREALDLWRRGTERPDASFVNPAELTFDTNLEVVQKVRALTWLSCLEASRLESMGDNRGAWTWHRATLRASRHLGRHGTLIERLIGVSIHNQAATRITAWAKQPKVDAEMLRQALAEVQMIAEMASPPSEWLKYEYLTFIHSMERPDLLKALINGLDNPEGSSSKQRVAWQQFQAFLKREPERSRRVFRLVFGNWLAYCDRPKSERPPRLGIYQAVFIPDSSTPIEAQRLTPESLNSWFESTLILRGLVPGSNASFAAIDRERARQATLIIDLASELYRREHGQPPETPEDLVGPYLKALPRPE
jgi:hypothetical protein